MLLLTELNSAPKICKKYRRYYWQQYQYSDINNRGFHWVFIKLADASLFDRAIALLCSAECVQSAMMSLAYKEGVSFPPAALNKVIVAANQDVRQVRMQCHSAEYKLPYLDSSFNCLVTFRLIMRESYYRHFLQVSLRYLVCIESYEFELYTYVIFQLCSHSVKQSWCYWIASCVLASVAYFVRCQVLCQKSYCSHFST